MFDLFLTEGFFPFTLSLALLFGLLLLEILFAVMGGTILGAGGEAEAPDLDVDAPDLGDLDIDLDIDGLEIDPGDLELAEFADLDAADGASAGAEGAGGLAAWLGFGKMPALIWLASVLLGFGVSGYVLQLLITTFLGGPAPWLLPGAPAAIAAIFFAKGFGALFARLLPKTETESVSERHLGRRIGIVTQGTARRGKPAEVRVTDRFGNTHYLRAEPLRNDGEIAQGTEVMVLRHKYEGGYLLVPLSD
jgi:hypothetical protein